MKNNNSFLTKALKRPLTRLSTGLTLALLVTLLMPQPSHAAKGVPMPECAKKLWACAKDAAQTVGQSVLTVGNILGHVVANVDCVAAMASGSPTAIGVTGLVVGLGAAGVVNPNSCDADIYGAAVVPVGAALDVILGKDLSSEIAANKSLARGLIEPIVVPGLPPSVGGLVGCGCGALEAGAKALEDVRKVAKFAAQTYESCGAAVNSCPGLKQAVAVLKGVYQAITDPSSIVQSCDSMSRQQYVDARLRDLIVPVRDQFVADIPWQASTMERDHWNPRLRTCGKYYDSHCYKEDDASNFCSQAVYTETFDPLVWAAIIEAFNGPEFDKYFAATVKDLGLKPVCPADPGYSLNLDPNQVAALEQAKGAQSAIAKACNAEMAALTTGDTDSLKSLAREMLPTTREGWDNDVRQKQAEKPLTNAKKVFRRVMTAAAVVTKVKMAAVSAKYAAQEANIANNSEFAAVPYIVLNQKYGQWANVIAKTIQDSCPKDPNGWNGKYDLTCVKELAISVGMGANEAASIKVDGVITGAVEQSISNGTFKGSKYFNIASEIVLNGTPGSPPPIRIKPVTAEKETARYMARWPAAEAAASLAYSADMPAFFGKQFERVAQDKAKRQTQNDVFAALEKNNKIESDYAGTVCDKLKTGQAANAMPMLCRADINKLVALETSRFEVSKAGTFLNVNNPAKPGPDAAMAKSVAEIKAAHDATAKDFLAVHKQYKVDPERVLMAGMTRAGSSAGVVKVGLNQGAVSSAGQNAVAGAKTGGAGGPIQLGQPAEVPGIRSGLVAGVPAAGVPAAAGTPNLRDAKTNMGAIGMPGLPQMQMSRNPPGGIKPPGSSELDAAKAGKPGATVVIASASPPAGAGASVSNIPVPGATAGINTAALLPFDPVQYRQTREQAIGDEWFGKCSNQPGCLQTMSGVSKRLIDAEVMQLQKGSPNHADKPAVLAFQNSLDGLFDPQFKAAIPFVFAAPAAGAIVSSMPTPGARPGNSLASMLPFDPASYRRVREKAIGEEWYGKCSSQATCLQRMAATSTKLIDAEVAQLRTGSPDHNDKAAVTAFQNSLDALFDPQFKTAIPIATVVAPAPVTQEPISNLRNPKNIPKNIFAK